MGLKFFFGVADSADMIAINHHIGSVESLLKKTTHFVNIQASYINTTINTGIEN